MHTYVALLRGVNVGGARKLAMADLRSALEDAGYTDVHTYIQSGNVVFTARSAIDGADIEALIATRFGLDTTVMLRTAKDLEQLLKRNPFPDADTKFVHVAFLGGPPPKDRVKGIDHERYAPEELIIRGTDAYLHLPNGLGRSKLGPSIERLLRTPLTIRNWNTVTKLADLASP